MGLVSPNLPCGVGLTQPPVWGWSHPSQSSANPHALPYACPSGCHRHSCKDLPNEDRGCFSCAMGQYQSMAADGTLECVTSCPDGEAEYGSGWWDRTCVDPFTCSMAPDKRALVGILPALCTCPGANCAECAYTADTDSRRGQRCTLCSQQVSLVSC